MQRHYSYFLVKPDGIKRLDEICAEIEHKFQAVQYYYIEDFAKTTKKLYQQHYTTKGKEFAESFGSYLYGLQELFGNKTILALVADTTNSYEELVRRVYETKIQIRKKYVNNRVGIITDYGTRNKNYVRFLSDKGELKKPRIMQEYGNYRVNNMNVIHSPDADIHITLEELKMLVEEGIIEEENLITRDRLMKMRKYKTVEFQEETKEPGYQRVLGPDISSFVKAQIRIAKYK